MINRYSIRFTEAADVHVLGPDGWDDDLAEAVGEALFDLSKSSSEGKYSLMLERFLSHEMTPNEQCDAFLHEGIDAARARIESFLVSMGCKVGPARKRRDGARTVKRQTGNISDVEIAIVAIRAFYTGLRNKGHFADYNPAEVNGWVKGAAIRIANGGRDMNQHGHLGDESGHHFRVPQRDYYPPLAHNPSTVAKRVIAAVETDLASGIQWPAGGVLLVRALADGGARYNDTFCLHAADWAVGSRFARGIIAPDKGTNGLRDKTIVISETLRSDLAASFDRRHRENPDIPDMAGLEALLRDGKLDQLEKYPLFPNNNKTYFKYPNFNNDYFRPCMERNNVVIDTTLGDKRVTPHWLRHANVTLNVASIFFFAKNAAEILEGLKGLQEDYGWKTDMIHRYAANFFLGLKLKKRVAAMDAINDAEEIKPRLVGVNTSASGSDLLPSEISSLHARLPR